MEPNGRKNNSFCCGVGTGGTISGVGKYLKEKIQKLKFGESILMDLCSKNITKQVSLMKMKFTLM